MPQDSKPRPAGTQASQQATRRTLDFAKFNNKQPHEFFEMHFSRLYSSIYDLVQATFETEDLERNTTPWAHRLSNTFCRHIEAIARPGIQGGDWDSLLRKGDERTFLLQGVIGRSLDAHVFSEGLFGASPEHQAVLKEEDEKNMDSEGFLRSMRRVALNLRYLRGGGSMEPPHFWDQVDQTTRELVRMLTPAHKHVRRGPRANPAESLSTLYQRLHETVAHAAWLSVGMQLSTCITHIDWLRPSDRSALGQVNVSDDIYRRGRREARVLNATLGRGRGDGLQAGRVKISVVPQITRYEAVGGKGSDGAEGLVSYTVTRPHVAYYQGWDDDGKDGASLVSLSAYLGGGQSRASSSSSSSSARGRPAAASSSSARARAVTTLSSSAPGRAAATARTSKKGTGRRSTGAPGRAEGAIAKVVRLGTPLVAAWAAWTYSSVLSDDHVHRHMMGLVGEVMNSIQSIN